MKERLHQEQLLEISRLVARTHPHGLLDRVRELLQTWPTYLIDVNKKKLIAKGELERLWQVAEARPLTETKFWTKVDDMVPSDDGTEKKEVWEKLMKQAWKEAEEDVLTTMYPRIRYAIFSHRWGSDEPTFQEVQRNGVTDSEGKAGYKKLFMFCEHARRLGFEWAWSDTCCINKESSAELQEAILSMFSYYRSSALCIVHLSTLDPTARGVIYADAWDIKDDIRADPWFTRGWTLQELVAPKQMKFYEKDWQMMFPQTMNDKDKADKYGLMDVISDITKIPVDSMINFEPGLMNIKERMTWAGARSTARIEDIAYCLLGIFDINMPILYGEMDMAFFRLQEEIIKHTADQDIFDWHGLPSRRNSMLAAHPRDFIMDEVDIAEEHYYRASQVHTIIRKSGSLVKPKCSAPSTRPHCQNTEDLTLPDKVVTFHSLTNLGIHGSFYVIDVIKAEPTGTAAETGIYMFRLTTEEIVMVKLYQGTALDGGIQLMVLDKPSLYREDKHLSLLMEKRQTHYGPMLKRIVTPQRIWITMLPAEPQTVYVL